MNESNHLWHVGVCRKVENSNLQTTRQKRRTLYSLIMGSIVKRTTVERDPERGMEYCNRCLGETNHQVLYSTTTNWEETLGDNREYSIDGANTHSLVRCCGCDTVRMVHQHWFSEDIGLNGPEIRKSYYPPNIRRQMPEWMTFGLSMNHSEISAIFSEIYSAVGVNSLRLAAMGIRALVERMMIDKVEDQNSFEANVRAFYEAGYVAGFQQEVFKGTLIEAGHAAMHRDWEPTAEDIDTLLDITEALAKAIYVDPAKAEKVGKRLPKRHASKSKKPK